MGIDRRRMLMGASVAALAGLAGLRVLAQPAPRVVNVVARKFVFLPSEIKLKRGEPVVLEFTAPEVVMGFFAPDLKLRAVIIPGTPSRVAFTPDRAGTFPFICDIFCGDGHEGMQGTIVVSA